MKTKWDPNHQLHVHRTDPDSGESWWNFVAFISTNNELFFWQAGGRTGKGPMSWTKQDIKFESVEEAMRYAETLAAMGELK